MWHYECLCIRWFSVVTIQWFPDSAAFCEVDQGIIHKEKIQQDATIYQNFIIPYLCEAQHVLGDTPPIIRSLKLHWQPLVFHTWKVVGRVVGGCCQAQCA